MHSTRPSTSLTRSLCHSRGFCLYLLVTSPRPHLLVPSRWQIGQHVNLWGTHSDHSSHAGELVPTLEIDPHSEYGHAPLQFTYTMRLTCAMVHARHPRSSHRRATSTSTACDGPPCLGMLPPARNPQRTPGGGPWLSKATPRQEHPRGTQPRGRTGGDRRHPAVWGPLGVLLATTPPVDSRVCLDSAQDRSSCVGPTPLSQLRPSVCVPLITW